MKLYEIQLEKRIRVKCLGAYSMTHKVSIEPGQLGIITKVSKHSFTVLLDGNTKGVSFPMCGRAVFEVVETK